MDVVSRFETMVGFMRVSDAACGKEQTGHISDKEMKRGRILLILAPFLLNTERIQMYEAVVCSRSNAPAYHFPEPWVAIQIAGDPNKGWPEFLDRSNLVETLKLAFLDIEFAGRSGGISVVQANQILDFALKHLDNVSTLLVHCEAGQSRSPAVAAALSLLWGLDEKRWFNPPYTPNMIVYRLLLKLAQDRPEFKPHFERIANKSKT
jgi:rhodanese-related sulfurtransferase